MSEVAPALSDGRYRLISVLGSGGMATVYRAWDARLQVYRAIKILSPALARKRSLRTRFEGEASTMALLEHTNIVRVYDVAADGNRVFIVMELVDGGSLLDRVKDHGPLPPKMALQVTVDMLDALAVAHRRQVVHRDIKPHNILLSSDGQLRITDFGIAQMRRDEDDDGMTKTGAVMGTWGFMAPEQRVDAKSVDARADVYSVGATLYSVLTGKTPVDLFVSDMDRTVLAGIPDALAGLIRKACRYDREDRYATSAEMAEACRAVLQVLPDDPEQVPPLVNPELVAARESGTLHSAPDDVMGGGTGLLMAEGPAPAAPIGPSQPNPGTLVPDVGAAGETFADGTMVPDVTDDPGAGPLPDEDISDEPSGLTQFDEAGPGPTADPSGTPWGLIAAGVAALLVLGAGGAWWMGTQAGGPDPVVPDGPETPVVDPGPDDPVTDPQPVDVASDPPPVQDDPATDPPVDPPPADTPPPRDPGPTDPGPTTPPADREPPVREVKADPVEQAHTPPASAELVLKSPGRLSAGQPVTLAVTAPSADYTVTLYYRPKGGGQYTSTKMFATGATFSGTVQTDDRFADGMDYYISAKPTGGGSPLSKGSGFKPLSLKAR